MTAPPMSTPVAHPDRVARRAARTFLPEIQALRMWAVGLVVAFHLWPTGWVKGGYVGVDAFFVISGFLITSHLLREVDATGRVRLAAFYARRARRLLPASLTVLAVCVPLSLKLLAPDQWESTAREILASTAYVENLWLASKAVTYSASNDIASPVQHYWSLSAEEQFYLVWPSLILLAIFLSHRRLLRPGGARRPIGWIGIVLGVVAAASLTHSILLTPDNPAAAYFVTTTRAWEFGAGAMLVLLMRRFAPPSGALVPLRYAGLALLVGTAMTISQATPFPGWVALGPVLGTAAIILAGDCDGRDPLGVLFTMRPAQWLGDISYSIYLWHWPLIVFAPYAVHGELRVRHKVAIVALTLLLAHLSKRYVEDATAYLPKVKASTRRSLLMAAGSMAVVAALASGQIAWSNASQDRHQSDVAASLTKPCYGAAARLGTVKCPDAFTAAPSFVVGTSEAPWGAEYGCVVDPEGLSPVLCRAPDPSRPKRIIALVGDSHAQQYEFPIREYAALENWEVRMWFKGGCQTSYADAKGLEGRVRKPPDTCPPWVRSVSANLAKIKPDVIVTSSFAGAYDYASTDAAVAGYRALWSEWTAYAKVVVIRDQAETLRTVMPQCLAQHPGDHEACSRPRAAALKPDPMMIAAQQMAGSGVSFVDFSDAYCDATTCHSVVGTVPIYYDRDHLTRTVARSLAPFLFPYLR